MIWNNFRKHDQFSRGTSQSLWGDFPQILHVYMLVKMEPKPILELHTFQAYCGWPVTAFRYTCVWSGNYQLYIVFPLGINPYWKQNILPLSATSKSPSRITGNNQMLLMMEELEATMQDSSRLNDVGDKLKSSRKLCYLFWKNNQCIHWSFDTTE